VNGRSDGCDPGKVVLWCSEKKEAKIIAYTSIVTITTIIPYPFWSIYHAVLVIASHALSPCLHRNYDRDSQSITDPVLQKRKGSGK
jgi:hypothetical protein